MSWIRDRGSESPCGALPNIEGWWWFDVGPADEPTRRDYRIVQQGLIYEAIPRLDDIDRRVTRLEDREITGEFECIPFFSNKKCWKS